MNEELKLLNKKIKFINEVLALEELFLPKAKQHSGVKFLQQKSIELIFSRYKVKLPLTVNDIEYFNKFRFFGTESKEIKRTVKEDKLIAINLISKKGEKFPFSIQTFKEMTSRIGFNK